MSSYDLSHAIVEQLDSLKAGSLTFWGNWFGRPYDSFLQIVGAEALESTTIIYFHHAETLLVENPQGWSLADGRLFIEGADRVRFQWFYYGRIPERETLHFEEYRRTASGIAFESDFPPRCGIEPAQNAPAVALHAL